MIPLRRRDGGYKMIFWVDNMVGLVQTGGGRQGSGPFGYSENMGLVGWVRPFEVLWVD